MLVWNVYHNDINNRKIELFNVFRHGGFIKSLSKELKQIDKDRFVIETLVAQNQEQHKPYKKLVMNFENDVSERIRKICGYYFWSKSEYEIVITSWPPYINVEDIQKLQDEIDKHNKQWNTKQRQINITPTIAEKIDIYDQLRLNWNAFLHYINENKKEIIKIGREVDKKYK